MHKSYFMWLQPSESAPVRELSLSGETSEWLFHTGYWRRLSAQHSLQYEQYEEEVMPNSRIPSAIENLIAVATDVQSFGTASVTFTFGWDANRQPLNCVTTIDALAKDLAGLQAFFEGAQTAGLDVYCQL